MKQRKMLKSIGFTVRCSSQGNYFPDKTFTIKLTASDKSCTSYTYKIKDLSDMELELVTMDEEVISQVYKNCEKSILTFRKVCENILYDYYYSKHIEFNKSRENNDY